MKSKTGFDLSLGTMILYLYSFSTSSKCRGQKKFASRATFSVESGSIWFYFVEKTPRQPTCWLSLCVLGSFVERSHDHFKTWKSLQENTKHPKGGNTERQIRKSKIGNTKWLCALMTRLLKRQNVEGCWLSRLRLLNFQLSKPIYNFNFWFSFF